MPSVPVFLVNKESGDQKHSGTLSYKDGWTLADARQKMVELELWEFEFQFIDVNFNSRIQIAWEKGNLIEDCGGKIVIIPNDLSCSRKSGSELGASLMDIGSSNASNATLQTVSHSDDLNTQQIEATDWLEDETLVTNSPPMETHGTSREDAPQVSLKSTVMTKELERHWMKEVEKLKEHMVSINAGHHKWEVKTWDKDGVPCGKIECLECSVNRLGTAKGFMDRGTITNCFTNFKHKHLITDKHASNVAANRGEKVDKVELSKRAAASSLNHRSILDLHIKIVKRINEAQAFDKPTFNILGDVTKEPVELRKFRLLCNFCTEHLVLIQRNLESNLESHCSSLNHLNSVARSQKPPSGNPVLSGKAGRPAKSDKRDVKQRTIQGFLTRQARDRDRASSSRPRGAESSGGSSSRSEGLAADTGTVHRWSLLCWGLWRDVVMYKGETRPIKEILYDQVKVEGDWFAEPLVTAEVWCLFSQEVCAIQGLFRHKDCSRVSELGGGFQDLTCEHCHSIKFKDDFRARVSREANATMKRGTRGTGKGRRLDYLTVPEISYQAKVYKRNIMRERKRVRFLQHRLCMLQARVPSLRDVCMESGNRKDIFKFCSSIVLAHQRGAFGGRNALWDLLRDVASNLNRRKQGHRFRAGTKLLLQALYQHGGRRVVDCLQTNGLGPSLNTLQRDRRGMAVFQAGLQVDQFKFIAEVYSQLKEMMGICSPVPCYLAEDETYVKRTVRWQPKSDTLLGFCGAKENHKCIVGLTIKVGEGEEGFNKITEAFEQYVVGHQARCLIVNPLATGFPRLCILATSTCNKFDADWVRSQWKSTQIMWDSHCLQSVGPLLGHSSDGDARRRKLMLEDYTGKVIVGPRQNICWEGWLLTHSFTTQGPYLHADGLHDQDFIHNGKKLVNPLDSVVRTLKLGAEVANLCHLVTVYALYTKDDHGLNREDILRTDRQNWASAQRLCSRKVVVSLKMLRERKDARVERSLGTEVYTSLCADYLDIFMNTSLTLRQRIIQCAKVSFFLRLWRLWCFHGNHTVGGNTQPISFTTSCIPMQTFLDIQMSVHFVVLLIIQFRDNFRLLPVPLHLTGFDACEQFFSKVGGMRGHERSYDFSKLVDCATSLNRLAAMDLSHGIVGAGKSHKKHQNIWMDLLPGPKEVLPIADQTDYSGIETNEEVVLALKEGFVLAQAAATKVQMNPSTSCKDKVWWDTPWIVEQKGSKFGGWCDVRVEDLAPLEDTLDEEDEEQAHSVEPAIATELNDEGDDGVPDVEIADAGCQAVMSEMYSDLLYGEPILDVKPTVCFQDRHMYKSTLVSQLVGNPGLSKDRLTRVKQSLYFNNLVDKPKDRAGATTMFMTVGTDCGVLFEDNTKVVRETRSSQAIAHTLKGRVRGRKEGITQSAHLPNPKRPRGAPVNVVSIPDNPRFVWWIGRVQCIQRKYNGRVGRTREALDLLDRPGAEAAVKVRFDWFSRIGNSKLKLAYNVSDPDWIDLDCVISTVILSVNPACPNVFNLDAADAGILDEFIQNHK